MGREDAEDNDLAASSYERSIGDGETGARRKQPELINPYFKNHSTLRFFDIDNATAQNCHPQ